MRNNPQITELNDEDIVSPPNIVQNDNEQTVNCQVCNHVISLAQKENLMVVKCSNCNEATPIKGAPPGKQYVRCPCKCLLICRANAQRIGCPRPHCGRIIALNTTVENASNTGPNTRLLGDAGGLTTNGGGTFGGSQTSIRVNCARCGYPFSVDPRPAGGFFGQSGIMQTFISCLSGGTPYRNLIAASCPHCYKVTSVGPGYVRVRWTVYLLLAVLFFIISAAVTAATMNTALTQKGLYVLWTFLYLCVLFCVVRAVSFCMMPVSKIDAPAVVDA